MNSVNHTLRLPSHQTGRYFRSFFPCFSICTHHYRNILFLQPQKIDMTNTLLCPCGSQASFETCCKLILDDHTNAKTAESLMRSRYTAFTRKDTNHILRSWHTTVRPKELNFDDNPVVWLGLEIHGTTGGTNDATNGTVDFTTRYLENSQLCLLRENSQFVREESLWFYLKGDARLEKKKLERNKPCPCGSGKKFKRCCIAV